MGCCWGKLGTFTYYVTYSHSRNWTSQWIFFHSTFADKHLDSLNDQLLEQYDRLINQPSNDWEIYYWMTEKKQTPEEYENQIMDMLKNHAKNENMEERIKQPELQHKKWLGLSALFQPPCSVSIGYLPATVAVATHQSLN